MTTAPSLSDLLAEYERALGYTDLLWRDLTADEICWRPNDESSAIGWHLGHQAAVAHYLVRNLTAAEASPDPELDGLMDSATPERQRGDLPDVERIDAYRLAVADRLRFRMRAIDDGDVGAPNQLRVIASGLLTAVINHEYQHDQWMAEVRSQDLGKALPRRPESPYLTTSDGYVIVGSATGPAPDSTSG